MGLQSIRMASIGTVCVYLVCSADDLGAGVHMFRLDQLLGVEFIQEGTGVCAGDYAGVLGGDEAQQSVSK